MGRNSKPRRKTQAARRGVARGTHHKARPQETHDARIPSMGICRHLGQNKQMFRNATIAARALAQAQRLRRDQGRFRDGDPVEDHTYECPRCQRWHLTSQKKETR